MSVVDLVTIYRDRNGTPLQFWHWVALAETVEYRTIARTDLYDDGGCIVSTLWMGMPGQMFESVAFRGKRPVEQRRYETEAEALAGHHEIAESLRRPGPKPKRQSARARR